MSWIDNVVVACVVTVGLVILYKALKEPIDLVFSGVKKVVGGVRDKMGDTGEGGMEVIRYG